LIFISCSRFSSTAFNGGHFFAAMRDPINAAQYQRPHGDKVWNLFHHSAGIFRHRSVANFRGGGIAVLFHIHAGENQDTGSANFVKAIDPRLVVRRIIPDTPLRFLNQFVAVTKLGRARRADLGARRLLAGNHAIRTHNAFADAWI